MYIIFFLCRSEINWPNTSNHCLFNYGNMNKKTFFSKTINFLNKKYCMNNQVSNTDSYIYAFHLYNFGSKKSNFMPKIKILLIIIIVFDVCVYKFSKRNNIYIYIYIHLYIYATS